MSSVEKEEIVGSLEDACQRLLRQVYKDGPQGWGFTVARESQEHGGGEIFICVARGRAAVGLREFIEKTQGFTSVIPPRMEKH